jgi:hypothetical protein
MCTGTKPFGIPPDMGVCGDGLEVEAAAAKATELFLPEGGSPGVPSPNNLTPAPDSALVPATLSPLVALVTLLVVVVVALSGSGVPNTTRSLSCFCADARSIVPAL